MHITLLRIFDLKILLFTVVSLFSSSLMADDVSLTLTSRNNSAINSVTEPVLIEAYRRIGINIEISRMPGTRSIMVANNGRADGEVGRLKFVLNRYKNLRLVPTPIFFSQLSAFTHNPKIELDGWESLRNYRIATPASFKLVVSKLKGFPRVKLTENAASALSLLQSNQIDIAVLNRYEGLRLIDVFGIRAVSVIEPPLESLPIYHLLHKKNEHLIPSLTAALNGMRTDGTLKKIWADKGASFD